MKGPLTEQSLSVLSEADTVARRNNCHRQWWRDRGIRELNLRLLPVFISPIMIGYDGALIGGLLTTPQCQFLSGHISLCKCHEDN